MSLFDQNVNHSNKKFKKLAVSTISIICIFVLFQYYLRLRYILTDILQTITVQHHYDLNTNNHYMFDNNTTTISNYNSTTIDESLRTIDNKSNEEKTTTTTAPTSTHTTSKPPLQPSSKPSLQPSSKPSINIEFVEGTVDKILRDHPHRGASDEYGRYGYIANVTSLRQWMLQRYCTIIPIPTLTTTSTLNDKNTTMLSCQMPFTNDIEMNSICNTEITKGIEGVGWNVTKNVINIPIEDSMLLIDPTAPKILCSVYTYDKRENYIRAIAETWGWRCDGFFASSSKTIQSFNISDNDIDDIYEAPPIEMINLLHEGEEKYANMWQKTRSMLSYMYDHYLNDYDYFYLCGDDTHLIVENLKRFLIQYEHNETMIVRDHYGNIIHNQSNEFFTGQILFVKKLFANGAAGYVISRTALKRLVEDAIPYCLNHDVSAMEDRLISYCLHGYLNITFVDGADENEDGKQRFHATSIRNIVEGKFENGFLMKTINYWNKIHNKTIKSRSEFISPNSIAAHHIGNLTDMKRHHIITYYNSIHNISHYQYNNETITACPTDSVLSKALLLSSSVSSIETTPSNQSLTA